MARLTLGSTDYPVRSIGMRAEDLEKRRTTFGGAIATARPAASKGRVWSFQTDILTRTEANTLEATLTTPGTLAASGEAVGNATLTCLPVPVSGEEIFTDMVLVSFELWEQAP